ncbi:hypothetical protein HDV05_008464 [Chytridiales sp. JEL 0842]|nr:hypothetical protein HDV05_008464 [Chytridiales sp. JEL 0842]
MRFFSTTSPDLLKKLDRVKPFGIGSVILSGPKKSGKTSLLFQYAFNCVKEYGDHAHVVFIATSKEKLEKSRPCLASQADELDPEVLSRVHMRYAETPDALRYMITSLPTSDKPTGTPAPPCCIIVDDFSSLFTAKGSRSGPAVRLTLALLQQSVHNIRSVSDT